MPDRRFFALVDAAVDAFPEPPRPVNSFRVAQYFHERSMLPKLLLIAGVGIGLVVITFYAEGSEAEGWILGFILGVGTTYLVASPMIEGFLSARIVRRGLLTTSDVVDAKLSGTGNQETVRVTGRRVVHHPVLGDYRDEFSIGAPWAREVTEGQKLRVLVAPTKRETWMTLGPSG